jgi:hypothetical protein
VKNKHILEELSKNTPGVISNIFGEEILELTTGKLSAFG